MTVVGDSPIVRAETASLGTVVEHEQVVQLPLNGRLFIMLAAIAPGVALPPNSVLPRINGGRPRTNEYLFDGISVLQPEPGQVAFYPIVDAIQEFKIESNSPPAEFGRFNGGVVNLTTKSGGNAFHGSVFEFLRNEHLNARNVFQTTNLTKPRVPPQPVRRHAWRAAREGPDVLLRGLSGTASDDWTHGHIDRADAAAAAGDLHGSDRRAGARHLRSRDHRRVDSIAVFRQHDSEERDGSRRARAARALSAADGCRDGEQLQPDRQRNRRSGPGRCAPRSQVRVGPRSGVRTPDVLPRSRRAGHGVSGWQRSHSCRQRGHRTAGDARLVVRLELSTHLLEQPAERSAYRRHAPQRHADRRAVAGPAGAALNIPGIPTNAQFPNTMPTFAPNGYQQLGSPMSTASNFNTSVTEIADSLTWLKGRHTVKMGLDWRWERLNVIQPPWPTGTFTFSTVGSDLPGVTGTGNPFASFLLGQVQTFAIEFQQDGDPGTRALSGVLHPGRLEGVRSLDDQSRAALHAELSVDGDQRPDRRVQPADAAARVSGHDPVRPLKKNNFGPRIGAVYRVTDKTIVSSGYGLVWIEMAGITTPFTTPTFPFLQEVTLRTLDNIAPAFLLAKGPTVTPIDSVADGRPRAGRLRRRRHARVRLCATVERVGAAGADDEHGRRGLVPRIEDYARRHPGQQYQSVDPGAVAHRPGPCHAGAEPVLRRDSAVVVDRRSRRSRWPS